MLKPTQRRVLAVAAALTLFSLTACSDDDGDNNDDTSR